MLFPFLCRRSAYRISTCRGLHNYFNSLPGGSIFLLPMSCSPKPHKKGGKRKRKERKKNHTHTPLRDFICLCNIEVAVSVQYSRMCHMWRHLVFSGLCNIVVCGTYDFLQKPAITKTFKMSDLDSFHMAFYSGLF